MDSKLNSVPLARAAPSWHELLVFSWAPLPAPMQCRVEPLQAAPPHPPAGQGGWGLGGGLGVGRTRSGLRGGSAMEEWPLGQPKLVATSARSHHRKVWPSDTSGKLGLASGGVGRLLVQLCQTLCHWLWSLPTLPGVCSPLFSPSCFNEVMFLDPLCYLKFHWVLFSAALRLIQFRVVQSQGG